MLFTHYLKPPQGVEPIVNGHLKTGHRVSCGKNDLVYFVSFAPVIVTLDVNACCLEGVPVHLACQIRVTIPKVPHYSEASQGWGFSTRSNPLTITAAGLAKQSNLEEVLKGAVITFVRGTGFFALERNEGVFENLQTIVISECKLASLQGDLLSCQPRIPEPSEDILARLRTDPERKEVGDYLWEQWRQRKMVAVDQDRFKREAERLAVESQQVMEKVQADLNITQQEEADRKAAHAATLRENEDARDGAARLRARDLMLRNAQYDMEVKQKEIEYEMQLADEAAKLAQKRNAARKLELAHRQAEIEAEEGQRAKIRTEEFKARVEAINRLIGTVKEIPPVNLAGVKTLLGGTNDPRSQLMAVLLGAVDRLMGSGSELDPDQRSPQ